MLSENLLENSRQQTQERLKRSLYRSNVRQKAVARRRTMLRQALQVFRWVGSTALLLVLLVWGAMQAGVLPKWRLVTEDEWNAPVAVQHEEPKVVSSAPAGESIQYEPQVPTITQEEDGQTPIDLKAEHQLNSLQQ